MVEWCGFKENWGIMEGKVWCILNLIDNLENEVGEWNFLVIECEGNEVKVWVNGELVNYGFNCIVISG